MEKRGLGKVGLTVFLAGVLGLAFSFSNAWAQGAAKPVVLKVLRAWPLEANDCIGYREYLTRVNKKGEGRIQLKDMGGIEVYPSMQQFEPLKLGTVDLLYTSTGYFASSFPEPTILMYQFGTMADRLRSSGVFKALDEIGRKEHGVSFIGVPWFANAHVWLTKPIKTLNDLKTRKLRSHPSYDPLIKGLGIPTVTVAFSEVFTALERTMVDGITYPYTDLTTYGLERAIKYRVDPPFWRAGWVIFLANAKSFDGLSADLKKLLMDIMVEMEKEAPAIYDGLAAKEAAKLKAAGLQKVELTREEWLETQRVGWEKGLPEILQKVSPKHGDELRKLMSQFYPPKQPYPAID